MEFRLLGPLEVVHEGRLVPVRSGKHRALLAALLLRPRRSVPLGELVDVVWGERPPANPRNTIQIYVARMRAAFGNAIETTSDGYRIPVRGAQIDIECFDGYLSAARRCAERDDLEAEADALRGALNLWRGEPLADVPSDLLHREAVPPLRERRMRALERRIDVDLRRGRHEELVGELMTLTAQQPLRERLWAQLLDALHRCGRRADALATYQVVRRTLADELGVDPGSELRETHAAVLAGRPVTAGDRAPVLPPVPRQLPIAPRQFTGRVDELHQLDALVPGSERDGGPAGPVVISAIAGTAGVGKTALAAHWGRRVAERFPDGQLWVNLRGYDPERAVSPEQALAVLLRALGVSGTDLPVELDARVGLYRSLLEGRRMLIVLDNAGTSDQVRPLLPGAPGCLVLVTSRDDLTGLVARDGATRLRLDLFTRRESVSLLRRLLGPAVADDAPDAVHELVVLCARLPLALRIAAERVVAGGVPLPAAVEDLAGGRRLDAFAAGGDPDTALRAVFSWSYNALPPASARLFRLLGLVPGDDWDPPAAAALAGCSLVEAERLLGGLAAAHLIERHSSRYRMHDLLRAYASERAERDVDRESAWHRLCGYYLSTSTAATARAFPSELGTRRLAAGPAEFDTVDAAVRWLDTNRGCVVAACRRAAEHGPAEIAWQLADVLRSYLLLNRHTADARAMGEAGMSAARRAGEVPAQAIMSYGLGAMFRIVDDYPSARHHDEQALNLFGRVGDRDGEVAATVELGSVCADVGELPRARELLDQAVIRARRQGLTDLTGMALATLFTLHHSEGALRAAATCVTEALELFRTRGNNQRVIPMLINRAVSMRLIGQYDEARRNVTEGLALSRELGARHYQASANVVLALVALDLAQSELALEHATQGLRLIQTAGLGEYEGAARSALGWVYWVLGEDDLAVEHHFRCLELGRETGFVLSQLQGHIGLGAAHHRLGNVDTALDHARQALAGAGDRRFRLSEWHASALLATIAADRGDLAASGQYLARADEIRRDTGYQPSWYTPTPRRP